MRALQDLLLAISKHATLLPSVHGKAPAELSLYFSPVFITPDVLLGRKGKQKLKPSQTLSSAQLVDDDIIYLASD